MEDHPTPNPLNLSDVELTSIDAYRRQKNTAVLTIMFTDIEGFTALSETKGEAYVHALHEQHDRILTETIEEDNAGVVIKFIGDSVMAVFSEPTAAAEKALKIQERLREYNAAHPDQEALRVRIGLHMGQTVIENKVQTDLFGRHVNKASRVESLAAGGHIYLSYPVYDSVKSWVLDAPGIGSVSHGNYHLKGIPRPEEIYEIYHAELTKPQAPRKGRKHQAVPRILVGAAAVAAGICAVILLYSVLAKPEVYLTGMNAREPIVDFKVPLAVEAVPGSQDLKKSITDLAPGKHVIHYVVSNISRYFALIDLKPGKNVVPVAFKESYLPGAEVNYYWGEKPKPAAAAAHEDTETYFFYDHRTLERIEDTAKVSVGIRGVKLDSAKATFEVRYSVVLNNKTVAERTFLVENPLGEADQVKGPETLLYEDEYHSYALRYSCYNNSIQVDVEGSFKD